MHIFMKNEEGWILYPLEDKNIKEIVLSRLLVANLRKISQSHNELTGLLYGPIRDDTLYFLGYSILGDGDKMSCQFDLRYKDFNNELMRRLKIVQPALASVLFHNHPRLPLESYPDETIRRLEEELKSRIFDYLWDYGVKPTIHEAIAEQSRQLSEDDISATFGRLHVLITDTERAGTDFSHINAYKFNPNSLAGQEVFHVTPLSDKPQKTQSWAGGVCSSFKRASEKFKS